MLNRKYIVTFILIFSASCSFAQIAGGAFENYYKTGIELYNAEKYISAQKEFQRALDNITPNKKSKTEEIDYYIIACEAERGGGTAEILLQNFIKEYPHTLYAGKVHLLLGNMYQTDKKYDESIAEYKQVNPNVLTKGARGEYYFNLGYAHFSKGNYSEAKNDFARVGADRVFAGSANYYMAYIDYLNNDLKSAREGFMRLNGDKLYADIVPFYIFHIDFKNEDYKAVTESADDLLAKATDLRQEEILRMTGEAYYKLGNYEKALSYLDAYAEMKENLTREESYIIGYCAYMIGDFEKSIDNLGKVAADDDILSQNASFHIGSAALRIGDKQRAKQAFSLAMRLDNDKSVKEQAMFNFAKLQYELGGGMFNETINTVTTYLNEFPDSPNVDEAQEYLLAAYVNSRNYAAAYDAVMAIKNPDNQMKTALQRISYFRGLEYFMDGDYTSAMRMFEIASANKFNPKYNALTKFWMAETYYRKGEYTRAIPLYQDYIVLSPKDEIENTMTNYNLAYCYFNVKNYRDAKLWFDRFITQYPQNDGIKADAYNRIADVDFLNKDYYKAIERYDMAINIRTNESEYAQFQRAIALGLTVGAERKIEALNAILRSGKSDYMDDAMYELGVTYTKKEQFAEAAITFKNFIAKYPSSTLHAKALSDLGLIYQNMGENEDALAYYKMVVSKYPNSQQSKDALLGIRNIYVDNNDLNGYFDYASGNNIETNISMVEKDSLTFAVAEKIYITGDCKRAQPLLEKYLSQYPKGHYISNATYYVADCNMQKGNMEDALIGYEKIILMVNNPFMVNSLLNAGALNFQKENYDKASEQYYRLSQVATNKKNIEEALLGYVKSVDKMGDDDKSIQAAQYAMKSPFANAEIISESKFMLGKAYLENGENSKALDNLKDVAQSIKTRNGSQAEYLVIETLFKTEKLNDAEKEIFKFSETSTPHQYWLGKSFLILGDIYIKKGDTFQAKATFQSIVDGYSISDDGIIQEAKSKLNTIK